MLSRVADSIYWMNRQIERAENVARATETTLDLALEGTVDPGRLWNALICAFGDQAGFAARHGAADQSRVFEFLAFDAGNPNSIDRCLQAARENARTIRDLISSAMWEEINKCYLMVRAAAEAHDRGGNQREFLDEVKRASQLITGVTDATMSHGEAWHFARMGRLVERADKTSRVLDVEHFFGPVAVDGRDAVQWSAVLESASALEMYRKQYGAVSRRNVAEFLVLDRHFPRAMHFCLIKGEESLLAVTGGIKGSYSTPAEQRLGRLRAELDYAHIDEILAGAGGLHDWIDGFQTDLNATSDAIHATFFATPPGG
ncbi:MAG: alpha-E domain-containing protein [Planctomycetes bacterium]|nr:alpha-E domain-containing protein [Planctomycetota bacterium]